MKFFALAVIVLLAVVVWIVISRQKRRSDAAPSDADVSAAQRNFLLVILRRTPVDLQPQSLETAARSAWTERFGANEDGSAYVERGVPGVMHMLQAHGNAFTVIGAERSGRKLEPPTSFFPESAAALWNDYTHDVSVGVTYNYDTDPTKLAAFVATLASSLSDDRSVAVYHPASRRLWALDEAVRAKLANGSVELFDTTAGGAP